MLVFGGCTTVNCSKSQQLANLNWDIGLAHNEATIIQHTKQLQNHKDNVNIVEVNEASPTSEDLEGIFSLRNSWCLHVHFNCCDLNPSNASKSTLFFIYHVLIFSNPSSSQCSHFCLTLCNGCTLSWKRNHQQLRDLILPNDGKGMQALYGIYTKWNNLSPT